MKNKRAWWSLSQLLTVIMVTVIAGSAFAAGDVLLHNSNNLGTKYGTWGVTGGKYGQFSCTTCHNKSTNNIKRVDTTLYAPQGNWSSSKVNSVSVVFNNMTAFGNDAAAHTTSTQVCQVCHSKTAVHRYNKPVGQTDSNHWSANGTDCTQCHSHARAFAPACNSCHGYPPNSTVPAIFGVDGLVNDTANGRGPTGALIATQPGAHVAHDTIGMKCAVCHSGSDSLHVSDNSKFIDLGVRANNANWAQFGVFGNMSVKALTYTGQLNANMTNGYTWRSTSPGTIINQAANAATCSVYCHGNWAGANGGAIPSWVNGSTEKACGACHGADTTTTPTTNAHVRHAKAGAPNLGLTCDKCHGTHTNNTHVTGSVKWAFDGLSTTFKGSPRYNGVISGETQKLAPSATFQSCSNVYCHSNVQGTTGTGKPTSYTTVSWSAVSVNCDSCHWGQGGAFKLISSGSHRAHVSRGYAFTCNDCHSGAGSTTALHADGKIQVTMAAGTYSQAGKNAGSVVYGSCATTTCHKTGTPTWGNPASVSANCLGCHGDKTSATLSGAHNKHMNDVAFGGSFNCIDCHATVVSNNTTLSNKALHANSLINYSGALSGKFTGVSPVTCSTQYCHSNGKGTAAAPPAWTSTFTAGTTCYQCHGRTGTTGAPDNVANDSHVKHAPLASDCWKCHYKTASKTAGQLAAGTVDHLDKTLDARLAKPFTYANTSGIYSGGRSCSTSYCHGTAATPVWGTAGSTNCNSCHKAKANVTVGLPGAHKFHLSSSASNYNFNGAANNSSASAYNFNCATCHATGSGKATHINGPPSATSGAAEVFFGYTSATKKGAYVYATVQGGTDNGFTFTNGNGCNTTYCHSNGQGSNGLTDPNWATTTGAGTCTQCHGSKLTAGLSGAHAKHVNDPTLGGSFGCVDCHANTVSSDTAISATGFNKHVNKLINYSGARAGAKFSGASPVTCSVQYCHSNGKGTSAAPPAWGSTFTAGTTCYQCHGKTGTTGAPDNVANDSHTKHAPTAAQCFRCHRLTASTTAGQLVTGTVDHLDGNIDARLSVVKTGFTSYSGIYNTAARTCSATYCHGGSVTTPVWGTAGSTNCNSCHATKPNGLSATHAFHIISTSANYSYSNVAANNSSAAAYNFNCASCHGNNTSVHSDGPVANGSDATIQFLYSSAGRGSAATAAYTRTVNVGTDAKGFKWAAGGAGNCNNTYCHSNGKSGNGALGTITWNSGTTATCTTCHGNEASPAASWTGGAHFKHITSSMFRGATGLRCKDCHAPTIANADNRTLADKSKHVNKMVNYSGTYAGRNKNCSNIYCHSNGKGTYSNTIWTSTNAVGCDFCHAQANLGGGSYGHAKHITKSATCKYCHSSTTNNDTSIAGSTHIDGTVELVAGGTFGTKLVSFTPAGTTCNNISCHSPAATGPYTNSATWGVAATCETCHPKANLSGAHQVHMGSLDLTSGSIYYNMTANRSPAQDESVARKHGFGCGECHPMDSANHLNGAIDVDLNRVGVAGVSTLRFLNHSSATYAMGTTKKCSNIYCHSNASRVEAESNVSSNTSLAWNDTFAAHPGTDRCAYCHGNQPTTGAHAAHAVGNHTNNEGPLSMIDGNIYNGRSGKILIRNKANTAHGNPNNSTTIGCYICHQATVTSKANDNNTKCAVCHYSGNSYGAILKGGGSIANLKNHVNGTREIQFLPIKVVSKAQIRPESFKYYSGTWKRSTYKNMSTLSYDTAKNALDTATMWLPGAAMASTCQNIACHNGRTVKWNLANWNDPNKCMDCHNQL